MAVDRKADHVGNHGGTYTDIEGMSRQFTVIDHDKHTSRTQMGRETEEIKKKKEQERIELTKQLMEVKERSIQQILAMPAISFLKSGNTFAEDCIIRDVEKGIIWDETFVRNFLEVRPDMMYVMFNTIWKNTVKEQYWFEEMAHDDILAGKWKQLI